MLFKTRSGLTPQTPKIGSVSLPVDNAAPFSMLFSPISRKRSSLDRRATTPAPERPPTQSASYHDPSMRTRTTSLTGSTAGKAPLKSILKTPKVEPSSPLHEHYSRPSIPSGYASDYSRPSRSDDKGHAHSRHWSSSSSRHQALAHDPESTHLPQESAPYKPASVHKSSSDPTHNRRRSSSEERMKKDVLVTKTPMKEEAISLSWPLVDYDRRKRSKIPTPRLYFDVGFDPRLPLNVRIDRGGCGTTITSQEGQLPVSSHCEVTKMTIICPPLSSWPIKVRHRDGITCFDVFCAIYDTFHQRLTEEELAIMPPSFFDEKFRKAFRLRCHESPGLTEYNFKQGPLRVDLLKGKRIFQGLERSGADWELSIYRGQ